MGEMILFLAIMVFLFKFSEIDKWWLWFAVTLGLLIQCWYELSMFGLIVVVTVFKLIKDMSTL